MFKNYVRDPVSASPINLAIARIVLSGYLLWVILTAKWHMVYRYPMVEKNPTTVAMSPYVPELVLANVDLLAWGTGIVLVLFALGIYLRYTAFVASFLVCYLGVIRYFVDPSWSTQMFFAAGLLLLFYALYAEQDVYTIDGLRRRSAGGLDDLNRHLKAPLTPKYEATPLRLFLLSLGLLYLGSGVAKLVVGGPNWISAMTLGRHLDTTGQAGYISAANEIMLQHDWLLFLGAIGTIVGEIGFIVSVLTGILFPYFVALMISFHVGIAVAMGPVFVYTVVFLLLFADWERIVARLESDDELVLVYDEQCFFCTQSLYFFKYLDVNGTVAFYSQSDVPDRYRNLEGVEFKDAIYAFPEDRAYEGYYAFRELCRHLGILLPVWALLSLPPVAMAGEHIYGYVAANRSRHFTCAIDD